MLTLMKYIFHITRNQNITIFLEKTVSSAESIQGYEKLTTCNTVNIEMNLLPNI